MSNGSAGPGLNQSPAGRAELAALVRRWIQEDPDPATAAELADLMQAGDWDELAERFSGTLQFGTAGLRGPLGGGPTRMNRAVVIRAAAGLSDYLWQALGTAPTVVIGYDARHGSSRFAQDTADVIAAAGGRALLMPQVEPTPLLAFAVRHLNADAGVMVTASHNPPQDNGYKVYLGGRVVTDSGQGAQIVPPYDVEIAAAIAAVGPLGLVPRNAADRAARGGSVTLLGPDVRQAYLARAQTLVAADRLHQNLRIVLTPMHGVGGGLVTEVLTQAGFTQVRTVAEQAEPDPDFPTVRFPNPEEPGALDLAFATAQRAGADLVIANDPDADRFSVAIPDSASPAGWRQLTGDEVGALLAEYVAARPNGTGTLACSLVSSRQLAAIARAHGLDFHQTLTGFKWISRVPGLGFGYEEALGYCVDPHGVRDKDGITTAVLFAALTAGLTATGRGVADALDDLAYRYGVYATGQVSARLDQEGIGSIMDRLRTQPPAQLAGADVTEVVDLALGSRDLPPTDGMLFGTERGDRVIARPSGTEPKLKCYLEVIAPLDADADGAALARARSRASQRMGQLSADVSSIIGS
ncbi:MAG: phospho-sugar mutase [Beutenbergiaceae bacterium]